ncbi:hypothetical protein GCM10023086_07300 [Streptomyces venetus]|uniref:Uncharacterized protein n=2 Tax=Streptomyces venetus TaxID=1701086 RepID=A0ABP8F4A2_9ACTN
MRAFTGECCAMSCAALRVTLLPVAHGPLAASTRTRSFEPKRNSAGKDADFLERTPEGTPS